MTLAIDFDGVIHDYKHPVTGRKMGTPFEEAPTMLKRLYNRRHTIIIHTVMATTPQGQKIVEDWLTYYKIKHHGVTAVKPNADIYLDDRAIRHIDWATTWQQLKEMKA